IIRIVLQKLITRIEQLGYFLTMSDESIDFLAEKGFDPQFGARPLHRAVQKHLEDPLAEFLLNENPEAGSKLKATLDKEKENIIIQFSTKTSSLKKT
ncbi:MAG: ATP-dependent Clp protease ATP-binding subunit, partial [Saprospiraceae bacterium]